MSFIGRWIVENSEKKKMLLYFCVPMAIDKRDPEDKENGEKKTLSSLMAHGSPSVKRNGSKRTNVYRI